MKLTIDSVGIAACVFVFLGFMIGIMAATIAAPFGILIVPLLFVVVAFFDHVEVKS